MAAAVKFYEFAGALGTKSINLTSDTFKVALSNTAPAVTDAGFSAIAEIAPGNGYTAGGNAAAYTSWAQSSGTWKLVLADPAAWTATGGAIADFRYAVLYDVTADVLMVYVDYGATISLSIGQDFTVDLDQASGALTLT